MMMQVLSSSNAIRTSKNVQNIATPRVFVVLVEQTQLQRAHQLQLVGACRTIVVATSKTH